MSKVSACPPPPAGWASRDAEGRAAATVAAVLALAALWLVVFNLGRHLPARDWLHAALAPGPSRPEEMLVAYSFLPRLTVAALAGCGLGLASFVFQRLLRNPLADPASLGVSAGAFLTMTVANLWLPGLMAIGQEWVALLGGVGGFAAVLLVSGSKDLSPTRVISAGLVVGLLCGSVTAVVTLFHRDALQGVFTWGSGSLNQNSWDIAVYLAPRLGFAAAAVILLRRPLFLLSLGDESASSLGISVGAIRTLGLLIAVGLSSFVVSAVGVIGFVGLASPVLARALGYRRALDQAVAAMLLGGLLLVLADQATLLVSSLGREIPTGAMTAALGSPLLMILLPRLKSSFSLPAAHSSDQIGRAGRPWLIVLLLALALSVAVPAALCLGQGLRGWHWIALTEIERYLPWRWPRVVAALCAGAMLGAAGATLQRVTDNQMASPEILGISSGASLGVIALIFTSNQSPSWPATFTAAAAGAGATMLGMSLFGRRFNFSPQQTLLSGIAFGTAFGALSTVLMSSGDPRFGRLLAWMAGSTYGVTAELALLAAASALTLLPALFLTSRWIEILSLGEAVSSEIGIGLTRSRAIILALTSCLTAAATLVIGPLSFVGLVGPHLARAMGLQRPVHHLLGGLVIGALIMVLADWLGRNLLFPYQVPAGLLAALLGGPYFLFLHARRPA